MDHEAVLDNVLYARAYTSKNFHLFDLVLKCCLTGQPMRSHSVVFYFSLIGEHQMELLDFVAGKFHEEGGVFKLLVRYEKYTFLGLRK